MLDQHPKGLWERRAAKAAAWILALAAAIGIARSGAVDALLAGSQIAATRRAWAAIEALGDYEIGNAVAFAEIGRLEGLHHIDPGNDDGLLLLCQAWGSATYAFIEDEMEQAEDREGALGEGYLHHRARALAGWDRAAFHCATLLDRRRPGLSAARRNDAAMRAWLARFDDPVGDAPALFWAGYAWASRVRVGSEDPALVSELFVGVAMLERSAALDPGYRFGSARALLGAYHARSAMAELDEAARDLALALEASGGRLLLTRLLVASTYDCMRGDRDAYTRTLTGILAAGDPLPEQRFANVIAKRRAQRYLAPERMKACGF